MGPGARKGRSRRDLFLLIGRGKSKVEKGRVKDVIWYLKIT